MEKFLTVVMIILFVVNYLHITYGILFKENLNSFAMYLLWLILDGLTWYNTYQNSENLTLMTVFIIGTVLVAIALLFKKSFSWTWIENLIVVLVFTCIVVTIYSPEKVALNTSAIALGLAGVPYWKDLIKRKASSDEFLNGWIYAAALLCASVATMLREETPTVAVVGLTFWVITLSIMYYKKSDQN
jgi:hypothetical protein